MGDKCPLCARELPADTPVNFDHATGLIVVGGHLAALTEQESDLFALLWARRSHCVMTDVLMSQLYQLKHSEPDPKIIDVFVCKIRRKLKPTGLVIQTHWGKGYSVHHDPEKGVQA